MCWVSNRFLTDRIELPEQIVLWWGGLRGSVSIALALSVPAAIGDRETIIGTVFGVVLFTLLIQGLTTKPLLSALNLIGDRPLRDEYSAAIARQIALQRVLTYLKDSEHRTEIDEEFYRYQETLLRGELEQVQEKIDKLQDEHPNLSTFMVEQLQRELLDVEAETYAELLRAGRLSKELAPFLQSTASEH